MGGDTVAGRLREARKSANLTQATLSERMGVDRSWIAQVETGRRPASLDTILAWATALGLDPHDFDPRLASTGGGPPVTP